MALLFPWATKEYLLWNMTIGQIFLYHNKAIQIKNGVNESAPGLANKSASELKQIKKQIQEMKELERQTVIKEEMRKKYGAVD